MPTDLSPPSTSPEVWAEQFLSSLQTQRDRVREFLAANAARLERAEATLEAELERLQQRLDTSRQSVPVSPAEPPSAGRLDWEAEKRRILAALESDFNQQDPQQRAERLRIQEVIATTERALAEKDRQIQALRQQLAGAASNSLSDEDREAATRQLLDADAVVQEERQRLKEMEEQWREKLRQAEVDLSLQRAKIARDRAELEERIRLAECAIVGPVGSGTADRQKRPRGRWLARLGLTEADRDNGNQDL